MIDLTLDVFASLRELPEPLLHEIPVLLVNRKGNDDDAYMRVKNITGFVEPARSYQLGLGGFEPTDLTQNIKTTTVKEPSKCTIAGQWKQVVLHEEGEKAANILGGYGRFYLPDEYEYLDVPVNTATQENLAYFGCRLVRVGEQITFDGDSAMPITITSIGQKYVDDYLMNPNLGAGAYLEVHNRPHFHMPLNNLARGALILGKQKANDTIELSGFTIPLGFGVYTPPWVIHADSHLVGDYMVVFSRTDEYSTVLVRRQNNELIGLKLNEVSMK
ncbi:hypothetical protein [Grimontia sp. NTOU-MAR1]|uniref:hypothetical protein n=1 Tax=Grimontia sp. NTOU-MAR1 TaxID=3111011 RepID=UPI002DC03C20|nr:hypothetical protein [Grimontia sp. NTOU-MAR1]WRV99105.1 hypothetical protein VP504_06730 [Grimontia sp. NTOU-MAR1]